MKYSEKNEFLTKRWEGPSFKFSKTPWGPTFKP